MASSNQEPVRHTPTRRVSSKGQVCICSGCNTSIEYEVILLEAMGKLWHIECFRCTTCHLELPESYYEENGVPYCKDHFYEKLGHKCYRCFDYITGPTMAMGFSRMYHPECFHCTSCGSPLGEKDIYCLLSTGEILCNTCSCVYDEVNSYKSTVRNGVPTFISIQQIKVTLKKKVKFKLDGQVPQHVHEKEKKRISQEFDTPQLPQPGERIYTKNSLKIEKLPHSLAETPLKTGDLILEINGIPIVNQDQKEINALMKHYDDCLYLTIERKHPVLSHDPSHDHTPGPDTFDQHSSTDAEQHKRPIPVKKRTHRGKSSSEKKKITQTMSPKKDIPQVHKLSPVKETSINHELETLSSDPSSEMTSIIPSLSPVILRPPHSPQTPSRISAPNLENDLKQGSEITMFLDSELRSHRAHSVPAVDAKADYIHCFRLSDLNIGEVVGRGFYGNVTKVTHKHTGQVMVMKEMRNCTEEAERAFRKEVQMLKSLNHPNILHFIGILYQEGKVLTVITEFIGGGTLRKTIKKDWSFPWNVRIKIARDIAAGMNYLHQCDIIHRDLTSKNCLLREDMSAVVADFGLARVFQTLDHSDNPSKRRANRMTVVGSPYWMAPEMLKGEDYDERVDIFSYGIVLCEIIARVKADPDEMPRDSRTFGLDEREFRNMMGNCPPIFYNLAIRCSSLKPAGRPHFFKIERGLNYLLTLLESEQDINQLPEDFYYLLDQLDINTTLHYHIVT